MILGILQARVLSTRLPGKVLKPILGKPMLLRQIERLRHSKTMDKLVVACSVESSDDEIEKLCIENQIENYRGSLKDVLDRYYQAACIYKPDHIVRLTGDCPLIDSAVVDQVVSCHVKNNFDYTSNTIKPTFPDGLDVEIMKFTCLEEAWSQSTLPSHREHVTPFFYTQPAKYKLGEVNHIVDLSHLRWTVDEPIDFELVNQIYELLYFKNPAFNLQDILHCIKEKPELQHMNTAIHRNAGMQKSLLADKAFLDQQEYHEPI